MPHEHYWWLEGIEGEYWYECDCGEMKAWPDLEIEAELLRTDTVNLWHSKQ